LKKSYEIINVYAGSGGSGECPAIVGFENGELFL